MAYNKTTWASGDVVTSEKLNNIESGISELDESSDVFIVNVISDVSFPTTDKSISVTLDKTFEEMAAAFNARKLVVAYATIMSGGGLTSLCIPLAYNDYMGGFISGTVSLRYTTNNYHMCLVNLRQSASNSPDLYIAFM